MASVKLAPGIVANRSLTYSHYLDKNLWNDLANLFSVDGSMELAQRGAYDGRKHVRAFLLKVFGRGSEGPVANRLGNHMQLQPVIDIAPDGNSAKIRIRMFQQMSFGPRAPRWARPSTRIRRCWRTVGGSCATITPSTG
jgi:hypothetical protein